MTAIVVDASVGLKWFVPEVHAVEARQWRNLPYEFHVPSIFFELEIANVLWKKVRRTEISHADADMILSQLSTLPLTRHPESTLLKEAFKLAGQTQRTVYDCLYLALAEQLSGKLLTADLRLYNSLSATSWNTCICWVADVPKLP